MKFTSFTIVQGNSSPNRYMREISGHKILKAEEETELMKKIRQGDKQAFNQMVTCNLKFVVKIANEYVGQGLPLEDLINEGNLGMIKAIEKFDETRGYKFISYAVWWIRQSIMQALNEQTRLIRLPGNKLSDMNRIAKAIRELENEFQRIPSAEEVADKLDMKLKDVLAAYDLSFRSLSLDSPVGGHNEDSGNLMEIVPDEQECRPDKVLIDESLKRHLKMAFRILSEREALVLRLYYGIDMENPLCLEEIGEMLHLTRERVRQIKEKALKKLKHASESREILLY